MYELEPGTTMKDGSIYAGISPETGNMMFVMPKDDPSMMTFEGTGSKASFLNHVGALGQSDWRLPTLKELDVIFGNKGKGGLKGTFNEAGADYRDTKGKRDLPGWYRTSDCGSNVTKWCQLFKTGDKAVVFNTNLASVRYIRDGGSPGLPLSLPYKTSASTSARQDDLREHARRRKPKIKPV